MVETIFDCMKSAFQRGERVEVRGLGTFKLRSYKGYKGRNPKTGQMQCWKCEQPFAENETEQADQTDIDIQQALLASAHDGWMEMGEYGFTHSLAAFKVLMLVFRLLATGKYATALRVVCVQPLRHPTSQLRLDPAHQRN